MKMINKAARVAGMVGDITRVCARPFFCGAASRRQRRCRTLAVAAGTLCVTLVMGIALIGAKVSLAVYLDGEEVGSARSIAEVPEIVARAESQLTELLGYSYSLGDAVSLSAGVGGAVGEADSLEKAIILSVDGVEELYAIMVNGEIVAANADDDVLYGILRDILAGYMTESTVSARFLGNVTISREFVTAGTPCDAGTIRKLLAPDTGLLAVETVETSHRTESVQFETEYISDAAMYEGDSRVLTPGEYGSALVTEEIVFTNGAETARRITASAAITEPVAEVVAIGTLERPKTASFGEYIWPADGVITSSFGYRRTTIGSRDHKGLDIAGFKGQDIWAADGGEVTFSGQSGGYGLVVIILHDNGEETVYGHCSKLYVSEGERVYQGQLIAAMGRTGVASGVHCHFEIRVDGTPIDPLTRLGSGKQ